MRMGVYCEWCFVFTFFVLLFVLLVGSVVDVMLFCYWVGLASLHVGGVFVVASICVVCFVAVLTICDCWFLCCCTCVFS